MSCRAVFDDSPMRLASTWTGLTHRPSLCLHDQVRSAVVLAGRAISVPFRARHLRFATVTMDTPVLCPWRPLLQVRGSTNGKDGIEAGIGLAVPGRPIRSLVPRPESFALVDGCRLSSPRGQIADAVAPRPSRHRGSPRHLVRWPRSHRWRGRQRARERARQRCRRQRSRMRWLRPCRPPHHLI
jgi:hypothetical protein